MVNKIGVLASGMVIGMLVLVAYEPLYQRFVDAKDDCIKNMSSAKTKAETSLTDVKEKVITSTDDALDAINKKIDELINSIDDIDISKVKGKSKMLLENIKQKLMTLKQN